MGYSFLGVDHVEHFVGVEFLTGSEHHDLKQLRHLEQEGLQPKTLYSVDFCAFAVEKDLHHPQSTSDSKSYFTGLVKVV